MPQIEDVSHHQALVLLPRKVDANPVGTHFSQLEKLLNQHGIKYFKESQVNLKRKKQPDLDDSVNFIIAFAVEGESKEFDGKVMQALDLVYAKFDSSSRIVGYFFKKTYKE